MPQEIVRNTQITLTNYLQFLRAENMLPDLGVLSYVAIGAQLALLVLVVFVEPSD